MAGRLSSQWSTGTLTQSSQGNVGFKANNIIKSDWSIQWHSPGSRWHFNGAQYFKVSSGV